jgi:ABC-type nitrate/sulfonate/bicarbonate transport system ATPase subunit
LGQRRSGRRSGRSTGPAEAYLVDAYSTIQDAIDNVNPGGIIYVLGNSGSGYAGFDLNKNVQIRFIADYQNPAETTVTLNGAVTLSQRRGLGAVRRHDHRR